MKNLIDSKLEMGQIIRDSIIPTGMSITEAAKKLGVSRPTLSKLLNSRAALSPKMAMRMEETFGADMTKLLAIQATGVSESQRKERDTVPAIRNIPSFPTITAREIEIWATGRKVSQHLLPVLVRRLVKETGHELQDVDFPGYDNAQRRGFDGQVRAGSTALYVPAGKSVWELSTEKNPGRKAEKDYQAKLGKLPQTDQSETTYVFVSTRNWEYKHKWVEEKNGLCDWKEVRAYDASDLEQWLESTYNLRIWLAEEMKLQTHGVHTLDWWWSKWAAASEPPMTPAIFSSSIYGYKKKLQEWLGAPPDRPFTIASDSRLESVAFIACLLREEDVAPAFSGDALVFDSVDALESLARSTPSVIAVIRKEEIENGIADVFRRHYCIVVRPRNAPGGEPDITIDRLDRYEFEKALSDMGIERYRFDQLTRESGLSPTILRRRLPLGSVIKMPPWARGTEIARQLIPMALVGTWHTSEFYTDREILATLANYSYDTIEIAIAELCQNKDAPVWSIGKHRGVTSKIEALFAIAPFMTERDLSEFIQTAEKVLSKFDPALGLLENKQRPSSIVIREPSAALRSGVLDTLILLAVHGKNLFLSRLGVNIEEKVSDLVNRLLTPFTSEVLKSYDYDLPDFAEAAPYEFLKVLQKDLRQEKPALQSLLQPVGNNIFHSLPRTGLLWALERLAWHREHFMDVVKILAELSHTRIDDNWTNKPINSLAAIFHSWLPQTAVSAKDRIDTLKFLCDKYSDVGWQICIRQINGSNQIGTESARPRWRAVGPIAPVNFIERYEFERAALDLVVNWPSHNLMTLGDLLSFLPKMNEADQVKVLDRVEKWRLTESDQNDKTAIREQIGQLVSREDKYPPCLCEKALVQAQEILKKLVPNDTLQRVTLLFRNYGGYFSIAKAENPSLTKADWPERLHSIRNESIANIWSSQGIEGILMLLSRDTAGDIIGRYVSLQMLNPQQAVNAVNACLSANAVSHEKINHFLIGFFGGSLDKDVCTEVLSSLVKTGTNEDIVRVFRCVSYSAQQVWQLFDQVPECIRDQCWRHINVPLKEYSKMEASILIDNLLRVGRGWDAFMALCADFDKVGTSHLKRLLQGFMEEGTGRINYSGDADYYLPKALDSLGKRSDVSVDEMVQLELASTEWISPREFQVPFTEKKFAESPSAFVDLLSLVSSRMEEGQNSLGKPIKDESQINILRLRAFTLLEALRRPPGKNDQGEIDSTVLIRWISEARKIASEGGCIQICDDQIGAWLSRTPPEGEDVRWPSRAICEVLESICSDEMASAFETGVYNQRLSTIRGSYEGGEQERNIATKYRCWADACVMEFPFVSNILSKIADRYEREATQEDHQAQARMHLDL
ncbi:MAG: helix-turn-helix domain-containing protein [Bacteroidetes bacterium]|nr:helix-turn-helix domain-containing protein [Bacteroidota bacterium]